ncbi:MAG: phospholipase, partial [Flavobacteriaceae bacterium]
YATEGLDPLRIFRSHGTHDPTVPVEWARKGDALLKKKTLEVDYKEYPSGHGINQDNFTDLLSWLKANP